MKAAATKTTKANRLRGVTEIVDDLDLLVINQLKKRRSPFNVQIEELWETTKDNLIEVIDLLDRADSENDEDDDEEGDEELDD